MKAHYLVFYPDDGHVMELGAQAQLDAKLYPQFSMLYDPHSTDGPWFENTQFTMPMRRAWEPIPESRVPAMWRVEALLRV